MGKSLIIPESDFSQNCISETDVWYTNDASNNQNLLISLFQNSVYTSEYISDSVKGKKINAIKVPKCQTGQITLYLANYPESGINPELRLVETINVTNLNEPQQILLNNTISLTNNLTIVIGANACLYFSLSFPDGSYIWDIDLNVYEKGVDNALLGIDFGFIY